MQQTSVRTNVEIYRGSQVNERRAIFRDCDQVFMVRRAYLKWDNLLNSNIIVGWESPNGERLWGRPIQLNSEGGAARHRTIRFEMVDIGGRSLGHQIVRKYSERRVWLRRKFFGNKSIENAGRVN